MLFGGHGDNNPERRFEFPQIFGRSKEEGSGQPPDKQTLELMRQLGASIGTDPAEIVGKPGAVKIEAFLEEMHERGLPGALRLPIGENTYARGYLIGATECSGETSGEVDRNGPYLTWFAARVYLCEDGRLRSKIGDMFVPSAFGETELPFDPAFYSDVVIADDFQTGRILANPADHEQRFYPVPLEGQLDYLAELNPKIYR